MSWAGALSGASSRAATKRPCRRRTSEEVGDRSGRAAEHIMPQQHPEKQRSKPLLSGASLGSKRLEINAAGEAWRSTAPSATLARGAVTPSRDRATFAPGVCALAGPGPPMMLKRPTRNMTTRARRPARAHSSESGLFNLVRTRAIRRIAASPDMIDVVWSRRIDLSQMGLLIDQPIWMPSGAGWEGQDPVDRSPVRQAARWFGSTGSSPQNHPNVRATTAKYRAVFATATMVMKTGNGSRSTPATIVRGSPMKGSQLRSSDQRP